MSRPICGEDERFIRGITSAHVDEGELSIDFFKGEAISVNRLCIADEQESILLLKAILRESQPNSIWKGHATFEHSRLKTETAQYVTGNKDLRNAGFTIWVEADPLPRNPGHAEVMPKVPRGLANYLIFQTNFFSLFYE